jgi:HK97 gp10 family phage protein
MADEWKIEGLRELGEALKLFPEKIAGKIMRAAVSSGAAVVRDDAKRRASEYREPRTACVGGSSWDIEGKIPAPIRTGTLARAVSMKHARGGNTYNEAYEVYVRSARTDKKVKAYGKYDAYYWRFVEFGTVKMTKRPFMRPAFEAKKHAAAEEIRRILAAAVPQVVAMLPGKH